MKKAFLSFVLFFILFTGTAQLSPSGIFHIKGSHQHFGMNIPKGTYIIDDSTKQFWYVSTWAVNDYRSIVEEYSIGNLYLINPTFPGLPLDYWTWDDNYSQVFNQVDGYGNPCLNCGYIKDGELFPLSVSADKTSGKLLNLIDDSITGGGWYIGNQKYNNSIGTDGIGLYTKGRDNEIISQRTVTGHLYYRFANQLQVKDDFKMYLVNAPTSASTASSILSRASSSEIVTVPTSGLGLAALGDSSKWYRSGVDIYYKNSGGAFVSHNGFGTGLTDGLGVKNTANSTAGNPQFSPRLSFSGTAWKTVSASSELGQAWWRLEPKQGADSIVPILSFYTQRGTHIIRGLQIGPDPTYANYTNFWPGGVTPSVSNYGWQMTNNGAENWWNSTGEMEFTISNSSLISVNSNKVAIGLGFPGYNGGANSRYNAMFNIKGRGTGTGTTFETFNSAGDSVFKILDNGTIKLLKTPPASAYTNYVLTRDNYNNVAQVSTYSLGLQQTLWRIDSTYWNLEPMWNYPLILGPINDISNIGIASATFFPTDCSDQKWATDYIFPLTTGKGFYMADESTAIPKKDGSGIFDKYNKVPLLEALYDSSSDQTYAVFGGSLQSDGYTLQSMGPHRFNAGAYFNTDPPVNNDLTTVLAVDPATKQISSTNVVGFWHDFPGTVYRNDTANLTLHVSCENVLSMGTVIKWKEGSTVKQAMVGGSSKEDEGGGITYTFISLVGDRVQTGATEFMYCNERALTGRLAYAGSVSDTATDVMGHFLPGFKVKLFGATVMFGKAGATGTVSSTIVDLRANYYGKLFNSGGRLTITGTSLAGTGDGSYFYPFKNGAATGDISMEYISADVKQVHTNPGTDIYITIYYAPYFNIYFK